MIRGDGRPLIRIMSTLAVFSWDKNAQSSTYFSASRITITKIAFGMVDECRPKVHVVQDAPPLDAPWEHMLRTF
jgi:hypothetical protein